MVLPAPRKPVSTVSGIGSAGRRRVGARVRLAHCSAEETFGFAAFFAGFFAGVLSAAASAAPSGFASVVAATAFLCRFFDGALAVCTRVRDDRPVR